MSLKIALAGNPNCGKTTIFNALTGSNQYVGNWPGVTVEKKEGNLKGYKDVILTDLPGIYSLSPYTPEEVAARNYLINERPDAILNVVDGTNLERNLYLTMQLMELDVPMVLALNMMDEVRENGGSILVNEMEEMLGIPVVPISAFKNEGVDELVQHAMHVAQYQERPGRTDFCDKDEHGGSIHRCLHGIMHLIEDHAQDAGIPVRFAATKIVEGDKDILKRMKLSQNEEEMVEHIICQMEEERGIDRAAAIADMRYDFIMKLVEHTVVKPKESKGHERSRKLDKFLTGKYTAIPAFIGIMGIVFYLTFNVIGAWMQGVLETAIGGLTEIVDNALNVWNVNDALHGLIIDGIFNGNVVNYIIYKCFIDNRKITIV